VVRVRELHRWTRLVDHGEPVGRALRTQHGVKPVFVSIGHRIDLGSACRYVLALARDHRLPETTRQADRLARRTLRQRERARCASTECVRPYEA
jgi:deoxyribonuclease V